MPWTSPGAVLIRAGEFDALLGDDTAPAIRDWRDILRSTRQHATTARI